ncbi:hypothetical protein MKW94_008347 [Papaver nudicaule]|uniref:Uncharacterized protein n=1 Tax=Papaver nudicaule TaxID=74823 RepID=A0AA41V3Y7_PAPNU|nr:hypothetical protein [Papaver nudicaule]
MGSPEESKALDSPFQVAAIATQPPSRRDRGRKVSIRSPFLPTKCRADEFSCDLRALKPALCITAAYGNILPGNLLPLYRGAAPVQIAPQYGVKETSISLAYTVLALDAGPIIASQAQNNSKVTHAAKLTPEEAWLSFCLVDLINAKIITKRICIPKDAQDDVTLVGGALQFPCGEAEAFE